MKDDARAFAAAHVGDGVEQPADALALGARTILVSNPTYVAEVRALCDAMGLGADVRTTERAPE